MKANECPSCKAAVPHCDTSCKYCGTEFKEELDEVVITTMKGSMQTIKRNNVHVIGSMNQIYGDNIFVSGSMNEVTGNNVTFVRGSMNEHIKPRIKTEGESYTIPEVINENKHIISFLLVLILTLILLLIVQNL